MTCGNNSGCNSGGGCTTGTELYEDVAVRVWDSNGMPIGIVKYCGEYYYNHVDCNKDKPTIGVGKNPATYSGAFDFNGVLRYMVNHHSGGTGTFPPAYMGEGTQGPQGTRGPQGERGLNGQRGAQGANGSQGAQGHTGSNGQRGAQGTQGERGLPGTFTIATGSYPAGTPMVIVSNGMGGGVLLPLSQFCDCGTLSPDTDGDGFTDAEEVAAGTNPNDPNSYPGSGTGGGDTGLV